MISLRDSQLQLLWTARIDYAEGSRVDAHQHADYEQLFIVLSGAGVVQSGAESSVIKEGSAFCSGGAFRTAFNSRMRPSLSTLNSGCWTRLF